MKAQGPAAPVSSHIDRRTLGGLAGAALAALAWPRAALSQSPQRAPDVLHSAPSGAFFENIEPQADGSVLFTSYFQKEILRWSPGGVSVFARLTAHPVDFVSLAGEILVTAHGAPFTSGRDFVTSMQILRLRPDGTQSATLAVTDARFLNGAISDGGDAVLIADSLAGVVWSHKPGSTTIEPFFSHEILKPVAAKDGEFALGANGIKIDKGHLYVSNSSTATLYRLPLAGGKPTDKIETVAKFGGIDDFAIADDGRIFVATHRNDVVVRKTDGSIDVLTDQFAEGATAVALGKGPSSGSLFVTTTGGLFAGLKANANLLRIALPKA